MLSLKGQLKETISGIGSSSLYYFSPQHTEVNVKRDFRNTILARRKGAPYVRIHAFERPDLKFPPYKEVYANDEFKWDKPTVCICNRYNSEWKQPPINFFSPEVLDTLFGILKDYTVVYFAVDLPDHLQDNYHSMPLNDLVVARKHGVKIFQEFKGDWNTNMMKIFANCEHYITMNGGYSILASMFSGTNIIYSKPGRVQTKEIGKKSFWRWYPNINGVRTLYVPSYDNLIERVKTLYVDKLPVVNVYTDKIRCLDSLLSQDYKNLNIIFHARNNIDVVKSRNYNVRMVREKPKMNLIEINEPVPKNHISKIYGS